MSGPFDSQGLPISHGPTSFIKKEQVYEGQHASIAKERAWRELMPFICQGKGDENTAQQARDKISKMIEYQDERLAATIGLCESPIERLMLISLAYMPVLHDGGDFPAICDILHDPFMPTSRLCVTPQFSLGRYRMDFYVQWNWDPTTGNASRLCVECDGKEFHGGDNWTNDKVRDGFLASFGIQTLRVSGQEIYKAEGLCSEPVFRAAHVLNSNGDLTQ